MQLIKMKWIVGAVEGPPPLHLGSKPPRGRLFGLYLWGRVRVPVCNTQCGLNHFFPTWRLLCLIPPPPGA